MRNISVKEFLPMIIGGLILFGYQNCAPVGDSSKKGSAESASTSTDGGGLTPAPSTTPPPPTPTPNPTPIPQVNRCDTNNRPTLLGYNTSGSNYTMSFPMVDFYLGQGNREFGDSPDMRFTIGGTDPDAGNTLAILCNRSGARPVFTPTDGINNNDVPLDINCTGNGSGFTTQTTGRLQIESEDQCRSGVVSFKVYVRDSETDPQVNSCSNSESTGEMTVNINVINACMPSDQIISTGTIRQNDKFGESLDIHGNYIIAGIPGDDEAGFNVGAAEVYTRSEVNGSHHQRLIPSDVAAGDASEGYRDEGDLQDVAIYGDHAALGLPFAGATSQPDGAVYMFRKSGSGQFSQIQRITPPGGTSGGLFGYSVDIYGTSMIIGAPYAGTSRSGLAYVYTFSGGSWSLSRTLQASSPMAQENFGYAVEIDNGNIVVGGNFFNDPSNNKGNAYYFHGGSISAVKISAPSGVSNGGRFGESVALSGSRIVIGAPGGNNDNGGAFHFTYSNGSVGNATALSGLSGNFGAGVAISGSKVVVGAPNNGGSTRMGVMLYYDLSVNSSNYMQAALAVDRRNLDQFGKAVAIDGNYAVVSAWIDRVNSVDNAGSAWIYHLNPVNPRY